MHDFQDDDSCEVRNKVSWKEGSTSALFESHEYEKHNIQIICETAST
jgi:hypothetical protein